MNFSATLTKLNSRFNSQNTGLRWAIVITGIVVNSAILFSPSIEASTEYSSSQHSPAVTYLPPSALTAQRPALTNESFEATTPNAEAHLALADALAQAGERDAAVEHYLQAMTYRAKSPQTMPSISLPR